MVRIFQVLVLLLPLKRRQKILHAGQLGPVSDYMASQSTVADHMTPMQYFCHPWVGKELYRNCRNGVLNYVILRPATAAVMWITLMIGSEQRYEEGAIS